MKKYGAYLTILLFAALHISCSIDTDFLDFEPKPDPGKMVLLKVKEYKTNLPVADVWITTFYCNRYDNEFGTCTEKIEFSTCMTDLEGKSNCNFPERSFHRVLFEKPGYWLKQFDEIKNEYMIEPEAWIDIIFTTDKEYPENSTFFVTVDGENIYETSYFEANNISTERLTLFGNQENIIRWRLFESFNASSDLLNSGSITLNPDKFEILTYTLNY